MELVNPLYKNMNSLYIKNLNFCINPSLEVNQINEAVDILGAYLNLQMLEKNNWARLSNSQKEYYSDLAD